MGGRFKRWLSMKRAMFAARIKRAVPPSTRQWIKRLLGVRNSIVAHAISAVQLTGPGVRDEYDRLVAGNVVNVLLRIACRFYVSLGIDQQSMPLVKILEAFRRSLPSGELASSPSRAAPVLIRFEQASALSEQGRVDEALRLFEAVFRDSAARQFASYDPFFREAVVRSGEFLGRYHDKRGDAEAAIGVYRDILSVDQDGVIARRLMLLLSRRGDFAAAADLADTATAFKVNLFPRLPEKNPYIAALEAKLSGQ